MSTTGDRAPALSVVIPVYDRAHTIATTLRSLAPALDHGVEVIAVDDGSRDASVQVMEEVAAELGAGDAIRILRQDNAGPGAARNTGADAARAPWIAFLDSDDAWLPWTAPILLDALARPDAPVAAFLGARPLADPADPEGIAEAPPEIRRHATLLDMRLAPDRLGILGSCNFAVRRDVFQDAGGFTDRTLCAEDTDLFYRLGGHGPVDSIAAPDLVAFRDGGANSLGRNVAAVARGAAFLLERDRAGTYGPPSPQRTAALAQGTAYTVQRLLRLGYPRAAYGLLRQGWRVMVADGRGRQVVSLLGTPVLSLVRPAKYPFRWTPLDPEAAARRPAP